jgi:hypothetical protein
MATRDSSTRRAPRAAESRSALRPTASPANRHQRGGRPRAPSRAVLPESESPPFARPRACSGRRRATDQPPRFHAPTGLWAQIGPSPHLATCGAGVTPVRRSPMTTGRKYRVTSKAGRAAVRGVAVGSAGGAGGRTAEPTGLVSSRRRHRTVHAIFPHTAPRRSSPVGIQCPGRHGRLGRGATMVPLRLISPRRSGDW